VGPICDSTLVKTKIKLIQTPDNTWLSNDSKVSEMRILVHGNFEELSAEVVDALLTISPTTTKCIGIGSWDLVGHTVGPSLPLHLPGKQFSRNC